MTTPSISVIIPVFQAEDTLSTCVESILSQTFGDWEMILVDDGNTEGSAELCDKWALTDRRIRVHHQTNHGQAHARGVGVSLASAEWVTFVDNDDTLIITALEDFLSCANSNVDIVLGNADSLHGNYGTQIAMTEFRHLAVRGEGSIGLIWGSLYRRSILQPYFFEVPRNVKTGEDYIFWLRLIFSTNKPVCLLHHNIYRKGTDTFSSSFCWSADYALLINQLREDAIPKEEHAKYLFDMLDDRIDNLFTVAMQSPRREWIHSEFYRNILRDIKTSGYRLPLKRRIYLQLPTRWLCKIYSILSNFYARFRKKGT